MLEDFVGMTDYLASLRLMLAELLKLEQNIQCCGGSGGVVVVGVGGNVENDLKLAVSMMKPHK